MTVDVEALLQPVSEDQPCGQDLEYDPLFQELELAAQGKPETQFSEAEPPDWKQVKRKALDLLKRSRDLRATVHLANAALHVDGWSEFTEALALTKGLLEQQWEHVHPQLDPDDQDPTLRVNAVVALCHPEGTLQAVQHVPLVSAPRVGQFSLRDIQIAHGKLSTTLPEDERPKLVDVNAAFMDAEPESLKNTAAALSQATQHVADIESILTERLGVQQAPDLSALTDELISAHKLVNEQLAARGLDTDETPMEETPTTDDATTAPASATRVASVPGAINSREDIILLLDKICDYYTRHEPSSPVPLLLKRAKRLVSMDFFDILRDLAPEALGPVEQLRGKGSDEG